MSIFGELCKKRVEVAYFLLMLTTIATIIAMMMTMMTPGTELV